MTLNFAYLSQGKLFLKLSDAPVREDESEFGQTVQARTLRMQRNQVWKNRGIMEMMLPPGAMQRMNEQPEAVVNVAIASICAGQSGKLL
jgi:hypothetical protein